MAIRLSCALACILCAVGSGVEAQTLPGLGSTDRILPARLSLLDECPRSAAAEAARWAAEAHVQREAAIAAAIARGLTRAQAEAELDIEEVSVTGSAAVFAPIVAGFIGDIAAAGITSAAAALEEASKARAIGVTGVSAFEFYRIGLVEGGVDLQPNFGPDTNQACLVLASTDGDNDPAVYAELALHPTQDGFYAQPVYVEYRRALRGAPSREHLPAELHIEVSTPGTVTNDAYAAKVFALARIPLPELAPGDMREGPTLGVQSEVLPFRPEEGFIASARIRLNAAATVDARRADLVAARIRYLVAVSHRFDPELASLSDEEISYPFECEADDDSDNDDAASQPAVSDQSPADDCAAARADLASWEADALKADEADYQAIRAPLAAAEGAWLAAAAAAAMAPRVHEVAGGSVTVRVRFVLIKNENRFGTAIAAALRSRSAAAGTAATGLVGPEQWTANDSGVVQAELKVSRATAALAVAQASGDMAVIQSAEDALVTAKLELNVAAAAAGRGPPYPGLTALPQR